MSGLKNASLGLASLLVSGGCGYLTYKLGAIVSNLIIDFPVYTRYAIQCEEYGPGYLVCYTAAAGLCLGITGIATLGFGHEGLKRLSNCVRLRE